MKLEFERRYLRELCPMITHLVTCPPWSASLVLANGYSSQFSPAMGFGGSALVCISIRGC